MTLKVGEVIFSASHNCGFVRVHTKIPRFDLKLHRSGSDSNQTMGAWQKFTKKSMIDQSCGRQKQITLKVEEVTFSDIYKVIFARFGTIIPWFLIQPHGSGSDSNNPMDEWQTSTKKSLIDRSCGRLKQMTLKVWEVIFSETDNRGLVRVDAKSP